MIKIIKYIKELIALHKDIKQNSKYQDVKQIRYEFDSVNDPFKIKVGTTLNLINFLAFDFAEHPYTSDNYCLTGEYFVKQQVRIVEGSSYYVIVQKNEPYNTYKSTKSSLELLYKND